MNKAVINVDPEDSGSVDIVEIQPSKAPVAPLRESVKTEASVIEGSSQKSPRPRLRFTSDCA